MMIEDWKLSTLNQARLSQREYQVAVLPTGAIEAHNRHLPEGQDFLHTTAVAERSCRMAWEAGRPVIGLPAIPYGVDANLLDFPLTIHVSQTHLDGLVSDIIHSLRRHGIRKIVILNGHGGNEFMALIRQIQCDLDVHVFLCNWWLVGQDRYDDIFAAPDDHAGEFETSVAMALYPDLVELEQAGHGLANPFRFEALRQGWVRTSRRFAQLNDHCAVGDPSQATAEKGRKYMDLVCTRIGQFLIELADAPLDTAFPHQPRVENRP
jgi:creatinine amidohydrolase